MNGEWVKEATTLGLITDLINCRQQFVEVSQARWNLTKLWRRGHKLESLSQKSQTIANELGVRFGGILWQMSRRVKTSGPLTDTEWEDCLTGIWQLMNDSARNMSNYRRFCGVLWDISLAQFGQFGNVASFTGLRPKFMLRQFVDEMTSSDARGLLRASAFGEGDEIRLAGKELLDSLKLAFQLLQLQMLSRTDDLSALTDGEITAEMVRSFEEPFLEYRRWLFES